MWEQKKICVWEMERACDTTPENLLMMTRYPRSVTATSCFTATGLSQLQGTTALSHVISVIKVKPYIISWYHKDKIVGRVENANLFYHASQFWFHPTCVFLRDFRFFLIDWSAVFVVQLCTALSFISFICQSSLIRCLAVQLRLMPAAITHSWPVTATYYTLMRCNKLLS